MNRFLIFAAFLVPIQVLAVVCDRYNGSYQVTECLSGWPGKMQPDMTYSAMDIAHQPNSSELAMTYYYSQSDHFTVNYMADSQDHPGDGVNTGSSYSASCSKNGIVTTRFGLLKWPLISTVTRALNGIKYVESFEGGDGWTRTCTFARTSSPDL